MQELCLVKLGGSIITDTGKESTARDEVIHRLAGELKAATAEVRLVVGHGSGSFGHIPAHKYRVQEGLVHSDSREGAAITQNAAAKLHRIIVDTMISSGIDVLSFPPSAGVVAEDGRIANWNTEPVEMALGSGFTPVVCGDVVVDRKRGVSIIPTEASLEYLAERLRPVRVVIASDIDGVFTADPKTDRNAKLIPRIDRDNISSVSKGAGGSLKVDVTGGMANKLKYLYSISERLGTECLIVNGLVPGRLHDGVTGREVVGTLIKA